MDCQNLCYLFGITKNIKIQNVRAGHEYDGVKIIPDARRDLDISDLLVSII